MTTLLLAILGVGVLLLVANVLWPGRETPRLPKDGWDSDG